MVDITARNGRIVRVEKTNPSKVGEGRVYDAKGRCVLPGLIDCHAHLFSLANLREIVNLQGVRSISDMQGRIRSYLGERKSENIRGWIHGRGWDQERFIGGRLPAKNDLDRVVPDLPAIIVRICGHIGVLNTRATEVLSKVLNSFGEDLVPLSTERKPTGIVKEDALASCLDSIPKHTTSELGAQFLRAQRICLRFGLTSVHCILSKDWKNELSSIAKLDSQGKLILRLSFFLPISALNHVEEMKSNKKAILSGAKYQVIGFKLYADGSLGAHTAALKEPYHDDPPNRGILNYSTSEISSYAKRIKKLGMVLACHAIGDLAIEQVLDAYAYAKINRKDGFRLEHCSVMRDDLLKKVGIATLCVQPMFPKSDVWINQRIGITGSRIAYPFKTLLKLTSVIGGSDAPVESIDPLRGIRAAMENQKESLTLRESIDLFTKNVAISSAVSRDFGSIEVGKKCDLTLLNCRRIDRIRNSKVRATFIGGILSSGTLQ